jgi:hypothetical protein
MHKWNTCMYIMTDSRKISWNICPHVGVKLHILVTHRGCPLRCPFPVRALENSSASQDTGLEDRKSTSPWVCFVVKLKILTFPSVFQSDSAEFPVLAEFSLLLLLMNEYMNFLHFKLVDFYLNIAFKFNFPSYFQNMLYILCFILYDINKHTNLELKHM